MSSNVERSLAAALAAYALDLPMGEVVRAEEALRLLRAAVSAVDAEALRSELSAELRRADAAWASLAATPRELLPPGLQDAILAEVARPVSLDPAVVTALLDHPATHAIMRRVLSVSITEFVKRAGTPLSESKLVSGVMSRARGFMRNTATGSLLSAVGQNVNAEAERRVQDFVDTAVAAAVHQVAREIYEEGREEVYGALRAEMLDSALSLPLATWQKQLRALGPEARVLAWVSALRESIATTAFEEWFHRSWGAAVGTRGQEPCRVLLDRLGVREVVEQALVSWLDRHVRGFAAWQARGGELPVSDGPARKRRVRSGKAG